MLDQQILELVANYRAAVELARDSGALGDDIVFGGFPTGCCGDTSYLLAEYLRRKGIETIWYSARRGDWSHAWIVVKDKRVRKPTPRLFSWPKELSNVIMGYGIEFPEEEVIITNYEAKDLTDGLIIDITGDQFDDYDIPVYVGCVDTFHKSFAFIQAHDYDGLNDGRLDSLYRLIEKYL